MNDLVKTEKITDMIYTFRGQQVMLDTELAVLYGVETKVLNQAVNRNIDRFPEHFRFQLTQEEYDEFLRSQIVTSNKSQVMQSQTVILQNGRGGRRYSPYVFLLFSFL